ncbi:hypothetical protein BDC45DRAFT_572058 [Circinella umbellata]|nr:hypothetical protein BDC45DRAFT_572058 [Circinella umbellata]
MSLVVLAVLDDDDDDDDDSIFRKYTPEKVQKAADLFRSSPKVDELEAALMLTARSTKPHHHSTTPFRVLGITSTNTRQKQPPVISHEMKPAPVIIDTTTNVAASPPARFKKSKYTRSPSLPATNQRNAPKYEKCFGPERSKISRQCHRQRWLASHHNTAFLHSLRWIDLP